MYLFQAPRRSILDVEIRAVPCMESSISAKDADISRPIAFQMSDSIAIIVKARPSISRGDMQCEQRALNNLDP